MSDVRGRTFGGGHSAPAAASPAQDATEPFGLTVADPWVPSDPPVAGLGQPVDPECDQRE